VRVVRPDTPEDQGLYGAAARRFAYESGGREAYNQYLRDVVVAIMIEKASAVEQIDEILAVPGVDMIQWGPSDFTMSSGITTGRTSPEVREVEEMVLRKALEQGVQPRAELTQLDEDEVQWYLDIGVRHFRMGTDMGILRDFWTEKGSALRGMLS
jgi:4-hydroxy-2-oxoheptanedioate aldolase